MSQRSGFDWNPFLIWILANILGFGSLGIALLIFPSLMAISGIVMAMLIISIPISIAQWLALRRISPVSMLWILSIPSAVLLLALILREIPDELWEILDIGFTATFIVWSLLVGFIIGLPQWLLLRRKFSNSSIWLLGSTIGVALSSVLVFTTGLINQSTILSYAVAAFAYAAATGLTLSWLLANRYPAQTSAVNAA